MDKHSILIVEDDEGIRSALQLTLEYFNYLVFSAANGQEALAQLTRMPRPCAILLDLMMPVMDGWAFAKALGQEKRLADIPIIVITAFEDKGRMFKKAVRVLCKPVDVDALISSLRQVCG